MYRAMPYHALGEKAAVIPALEQALVEHADWMYSLGRQPLLEDLRGETDFQAVVAKLGLP